MVFFLLLPLSLYLLVVSARSWKAIGSIKQQPSATVTPAIAKPSTADKMHTKLMLSGCSFFVHYCCCYLCAQHANMLITVIRTLIRNDIYPVFGIFLSSLSLSHSHLCILQTLFLRFNTKRTDKIYLFILISVENKLNC